jgi:hypothetical protein
MDQVQANRQTLGFIHKKTEKLVTAIYMLSNFFGQEEPLRIKVRELALDLFSNISFVFYNNTPEADRILAESVSIIDESISCFEIANISGLVSRMNFTILKDELISLKDTIESSKKNGAGQTLLIPSDFFSGDRFLSGTQEERKHHPSESRSVKDNHPAAQHADNENTNVADMELQRAPVALIKKEPQVISERKVYNKRQNNLLPNPLSSSSSKKKNNRSETILKILRKKDNLTVKDIARVVSGCSEKTIQRELLALVQKNVLKKIGERRWSRYSLA